MTKSAKSCGDIGSTMASRVNCIRMDSRKWHWKHHTSIRYCTTCVWFMIVTLKLTDVLLRVLCEELVEMNMMVFSHLEHHARNTAILAIFKFSTTIGTLANSLQTTTNMAFDMISCFTNIGIFPPKKYTTNNFHGNFFPNIFFLWGFSVLKEPRRHRFWVSVPSWHVPFDWSLVTLTWKKRSVGAFDSAISPRAQGFFNDVWWWTKIYWRAYDNKNCG